MKGQVHKMVICENEEEALKLGHPLKVYDGNRWVVGILWKTLEMIGTEKYHLLVIEDGE